LHPSLPSGLSPLPPRFSPFPYTTLFRSDFVWGAAAAAYQIEGAHDLDGKGPSVWDAFCERPGAIWNGDDGRVACNHYRRYAEDRSEEHTSELQSRENLVCRLLLEKKNTS